MKSQNVRYWVRFVAIGALLMIAPLRGYAADGVYVVTYLDVRSTSIDEGVALAMQYRDATRLDMGNVGVDAYQEIDRSHRLVILETWRDRAAFAGHEKAAHTAQFRDKLKAIHRSPYDQRVNHGFAVDSLLRAAGPKVIYVVTHVDVPGARRAEAETLLKQLVPPSRTDPGNVRYDVYQQNEPRTNHFTLFAAWNDPRALDDYGGTRHWLQFREALAPMLGALYDERLYQRLKPVGEEE